MHDPLGYFNIQSNGCAAGLAPMATCQISAQMSPGMARSTRASLEIVSEPTMQVLNSTLLIGRGL